MNAIGSSGSRYCRHQALRIALLPSAWSEDRIEIDQGTALLFGDIPDDRVGLLDSVVGGLSFIKLPLVAAEEVFLHTGGQGPKNHMLGGFLQRIDKRFILISKGIQRCEVFAVDHVIGADDEHHHVGR